MKRRTAAYLETGASSTWERLLVNSVKVIVAERDFRVLAGRRHLTRKPEPLSSSASVSSVFEQVLTALEWECVLVSSVKVIGLDRGVPAWWAADV